MLPTTKVAIITPFYNEPLEWLHQAHESVLAQDYACTHILIGDQASVSMGPDLIGQSGQSSLAPLILNLPKGVADYGDTPRAVGTMYAAGLGFDAIAYLDGDNFFKPDHISSLVECQRATQASIVTSRRCFVRLDGSYMAECLASDGVIFCDTNCLFVMREAFHLLSYWALMDRQYHPIDDRVMWHHLKKSGLTKAHTGLATVCYRATHEGFYHDLNELPPEGVKRAYTSDIPLALKLWEDAGNPPLRPRWAYCKYRPPLTALTESGLT